MTDYTNFTSDFPKRCLDVLDMALPKASEEGRDVTLLLMAASASFLVSFERLKSSHPFGDAVQEKAVSSRLDELYKTNFVSSVLCPNATHSWTLGENAPSVKGDLDAWLPSAKLHPIGNKKEVKATLVLIRNALAHGNIHTTGTPIEQLVFVTEVREKSRLKTGKSVEYDVLSVSLADFNCFVRAWINFLQATDQPSEISA